MRTSRAALVASFFASTFAVSTAHAGDMDPTPERFVIQPSNLPAGQTCQTLAADPNATLARGQDPGSFPCRPDNASFKNFISELGFAMAPSAFNPARTTGVGGFQVGLEASYTGINNGRDFWRNGTRGSQDANTKQFSIVNGSPDGVIQVYSLKARKGLPLGFEIGGALGYVSNTSLWVVGGDVRWSMLEGFRTGALGFLPDVSVGTGVRTVTGSSRFYLTTVGIDVRVSKPFTLADQAQLIPSLGFQRLLIFGDSNVVDSTPNVDAVGQCGFAGLDPTSGSPTCRNKLSNGSDANTDFTNNFTFDSVRLHRNRGMIAINYRYELVWLGAQIAADLNKPNGEKNQQTLVGGRQWTLSLEAGVHF